MGGLTSSKTSSSGTRLRAASARTFARTSPMPPLSEGPWKKNKYAGTREYHRIKRGVLLTDASCKAAKRVRMRVELTGVMIASGMGRALNTSPVAVHWMGCPAMICRYTFAKAASKTGSMNCWCRSDGSAMILFIPVRPPPPPPVPKSPTTAMELATEELLAELANAALGAGFLGTELTVPQDGYLSAESLPPTPSSTFIVRSPFPYASPLPAQPSPADINDQAESPIELTVPVDSSATEPHPATPHVRRKRFPPRLQSLKNSKSSVDPPPLPTNNNLLVIDAPEEGEHENSKTPRAGSFDQEITAPPSPRSRRTRKTSGETEPRPRKVSTEGRTRKISNESRRKVSAEREPKHRRESAAVEGDDEGYGELLSAYESEDAV
ncbi:hypothetical protein NUW54_g2566 [Trametes sanguinea]|uniref:Uncharacterized protein n=1 Tax=Trametes sanguinea TaxID=158606 RepID=A0ACC1Q3S2_9APHY|nr:hypothetical protein NUW54_g2566 [Trametes sanguinea]